MASEDVIVRLQVAGQGQFAQAMDRAKGSTQGVGDATQQAGQQSRRGAKDLLKAAAAAGVLYKGFNFLKGAVNTTETLAKSTSAFSRASGLDRASSQAWVVTAQQRGLEVKQLQMGMATLGRQLGSTSKTTAKSFDAMGLSQKRLLAMPMQQRMGAIANAFERMEDGPQKAAAAQRLFGRSGQALLPILNEGAKGVNENLDAARRLVPYNQGAAKSALELAKQQRTLNTATMGIKVAIGNALVPVISSLAKAFIPVITSVTELMNKSPVFKAVILGLTAAFGALAVAVIAATLPLTGTIAIAAGVVAGLTAIAAGFAVAYQKVGWFRNAVNAVWSFIKSNWPILVSILAAPAAPIILLIRHFGTVKSAAVSAFNTIKSAVTGAANTVRSVGRGMFDGIKQGITSAANWVWKQANWIVDRIKEIPSRIAGVFSGIAGSIGNIASSINPFATGGIVAAQTGLSTGRATTTLVGERGPEILNLPSGSRVTPLPPPTLSPSQLTGADGTVRVPVYLDSRQIAEAIGSFAANQQAAR